jgi:ribosomal protein S18 acetylase RimI-like enzyme
VDGIEIRKMSTEDMAAACRILGLAFADNPNTLAIVGGDRARAERMLRTGARVAKLARKASHALIAEQGGGIVGVLNAAEWPQCQMGTLEKLATAPTMIRAAGSGSLRALKLSTVWARHDPHEPHWHVGPIGVLPEVHGRGVGTALLNAFLESIDTTRSAAYLEADVDKNVALYQKVGFKVTAREDILGVDNRFMWREPQPTPTG